MKKAVLASIVLVILITGCGNGKNDKTKSSGKPVTPKVAILEIRENMFITQITDIMKNYKDYLGKTIKFEGFIKPTEWKGDHHYYVIRKAPGCCGDDGEVGFEVNWDSSFQGSCDGTDREKYPKKDDWVEASGELKIYEKLGMSYLYIALSELKVLEKRGAEFVSR